MAKKRRFIVFIPLILICLLCCSCSLQHEKWQEKYDLGIRYLEEGKHEEAVIAFTAAIKIDEKQVPAFAGRGDAYMGIADVDSAILDYQTVLDAEPQIAEYYLKLAFAFVEKEDIDQAKSVLQNGYNVISDAILLKELERMDHLCTVNGRVLRYPEESPMSQATVDFGVLETCKVPLVAKTDESGRFTFRVFSGDYNVTILNEGYQTLTFSQSTQSDQTVDLGDLYLLSKDDTELSSISGVVKDFITGEAVPDAKVWIASGWTIEAESLATQDFVQTDTHGIYTFENLHPGYYSALVDKNNSRADVIRFFVSSRIPNTVDLIINVDPGHDKFDLFLEMFRNTHLSWSSCPNEVNFDECDLSLIIDNLILSYPYYDYGLYSNGNFTDYIKGSYFGENGEWVPPIDDPMHHWSQEIGAYVFDANGVDWIITKVFGRTIDHNLATDLHYYFDSLVYAKAPGGLGSPETGLLERRSEESHRQIKNNLYEFTIQDTEIWQGQWLGGDTWEEEQEVFEYHFVASLEYDSSYGYYWSIKEMRKSTDNEELPVKTDISLYEDLLNNLMVSDHASYGADGRMESITEYAEYGLYDVNADGTLELILLNPGPTHCDLYTVKDHEIVFCGSFDCYHVYKSDAGLIAHAGGMGSMHLEYVINYSLDDELSLNTDFIMETEGNTYEDIDNYVSSLEPLELWGIRDITGLKKMG